MARIAEEVELRAVQSLARARSRDRDTAGSVEANLGAIVNAVRDLDAAIAAAEANVDLSPAGKTKARRAAAVAARQRLDGLRVATADKLATAASTLRESLAKRATSKAKVDPIESLRREIRHSEIRRSVAHLDDIERDHLYRTTTDDEVREALATAPPIIASDKRGALPGLPVAAPFVSPSLVAAENLRRATSVATPEEAGQIASFESQAGDYEAAISAALHSIDAAFPELKSDPLADVMAASGSASAE